MKATARARLASAVPILFLVSLLTFGLMHFIPGDPAVAIAGLSATPEQIIQLRHDLGLDQPWLTQLYRWYAGLFVGDLGRSLLMGHIGQWENRLITGGREVVTRLLPAKIFQRNLRRVYSYAA